MDSLALRLARLESGEGDGALRIRARRGGRAGKPMGSAGDLVIVYRRTVGMSRGEVIKGRRLSN